MEERQRRREEAPLHPELKATKTKMLSLSLSHSLSLSLSLTHFLYEQEDAGARWLLLQIQSVSSITTSGKFT
jgi:hypothetical protein